MKTKRMIVLAIVAVMLLTTFSACTTENSPGANTTAAAQTTAAASAAASNAAPVAPAEVVNITALMSKHSLTKDFGEMQWLMALQEQCGVNVEWQQITADWGQKKAPLFASGSIPDLLISATSNDDYALYPGLFEDLAPWIDGGSMPNVAIMFEDAPMTRVIAETYEGNIYATPKYQRYWPFTSQTVIINKTWLDAVNKPVPTTWDELHEVLLAFKNEDPNGNGEADEIPMDFNPSGSEGIMNAGYGPLSLIGATGLQFSENGGGGYFVEGGKVKSMWVDERFKTLMVYLAKLNADGLINPEALTNDYSTFQATARGDGEIAKVGLTWCWEIADRVGNVLEDQYVVQPPLKMSADSPEDVRWSYTLSYNYGNNRAAVSAKAANKEAVIRFLDGFYGPNMGMQVLFGGIADGCIGDNGDGSFSVLPPTDPAIDPGTWKWTNSMADSGPIYIPNDLNLTLGIDMAKVVDQKAVYEPYYSKINMLTEFYPQGFMKYATDDQATLAMNQANLNNLGVQQWSAWLTNQQDVEATWESFVASMWGAGLQQNLDIRQASYDRYLETQK